MRRVMLYFGSFNPVHKGHLAVAEHLLRKGVSDELWFVVSPKNPLKDVSMIIEERDRYNMVEIAIAESELKDAIKVCDVEFSMPKPSYTIDTLDLLAEQYSDVVFTLLFGSDITGEIEKWKEWERLLRSYKIYIYPRKGYAIEREEAFTVLDNVPYQDYSSTEIRDAINEGKDASGMLSDGVYEYIIEHKLWK